jgi:hypothetical protein
MSGSSSGEGVVTVAGGPSHQRGWMTWTGRAMSALPVLSMLVSGFLKLAHAQVQIDGWEKLQFPIGTMVPIGLIELVCVLLYLIPRTAVLGAILMSAYLTAAFCSHLRIGDFVGIGPLLQAVFTWGGLYLRDAEIRSLLPVRRKAA